MRNLIYISLIGLFISSCDADKVATTEELIQSGDKELMNNRKQELSKQAETIAMELGSLNQALENLKGTKDYPLITSYTVGTYDFSHYIDLQGDVATKQNIILFPEFSGILTEVYVREGDRVKKSQLLAKIDDGGLSQQLAQMEIQYELAKTTFERQQRLWDQKIGSEIQFLQAKASFESQDRAIEQMQNQLEKTYVRAPFDGVVDAVFSDQGQVVNPGQNQLMRIVNLDDMYVKAEVPESYIASISKGTEAKIYFSSLGKSYNSKVRQVGAFINPANRTFSIEVPLNNEDNTIKPNLIASLSLKDYSKDQAVVIPNQVVQEDAQGEPFVFVIKEGKRKQIASLEKRYIKTGMDYDGYLEVKEGLLAGDQIVEEGAKNMRAGLTVSIKN